MAISPFLALLSMILGLGLFGYILWKVVTHVGGSLGEGRYGRDDEALHRVLDELDQLRTQNSILTDRLKRIEEMLEERRLPPPEN
jgi:hypothetical protein